ncbi:hypothetical protein DSO57_1009543 [Entomophthora muscae]|uniref:Uncharacterized protein n=1 Tax=Entomophthora muscae TaxID=34485 RepID=A0ACC2RLL0_9FUNG|nr:hypothetical protein DSO57_1009543 [Entomophthora muscae]
MASFIIAAASCGLLALIRPFLALAVVGFIYGTAAGGFASSFVSVCAALFGQESLSTFLGIVCAFIGAGQLVGLMSSSYVIQHFQNYALVFYLSAAFYLLGVPCILAMKLLYFHRLSPKHS